jgi:hypothetical protein
MSKSRNRRDSKPRANTLTSIDWASLKVGLTYTFHSSIHFDDFDVMRNKAHNAAKRRGLKAITKRHESGKSVDVKFYKPKTMKPAKAG